MTILDMVKRWKVAGAIEVMMVRFKNLSYF